MRPAGTLPVSIVGSVTTEQILLTAQPPQVPVALGIMPGSALDSKVLRGSISGFTKLKAAGNVTLNLYAGRSTTIANNTQLASLVLAQPIGTAPFGVLIPAAIYNAAQGKLIGSTALIGATGLAAAAAAWAATVPLVGDPLGGALAYLTLTFTFAAADPTNLATLTEFVLDV